MTFAGVQRYENTEQNSLLFHLRKKEAKKLGNTAHQATRTSANPSSFHVTFHVDPIATFHPHYPIATHVESKSFHPPPGCLSSSTVMVPSPTREERPAHGEKNNASAECILHRPWPHPPHQSHPTPLHSISRKCPPSQPFITTCDCSKKQPHHFDRKAFSLHLSCRTISSPSHRHSNQKLVSPNAKINYLIPSTLQNIFSSLSARHLLIYYMRCGPCASGCARIRRRSVTVAKAWRFWRNTELKLATCRSEEEGCASPARCA